MLAAPPPDGAAQATLAGERQARRDAEELLAERSSQVERLVAHVLELREQLREHELLERHHKLRVGQQRADIVRTAHLRPPRAARRRQPPAWGV